MAEQYIHVYQYKYENLLRSTLLNHGFMHNERFKQ